MSILVTFAGVNYTIPEPGDAFTKSVTDYLNALAAKAIPLPYGGNDIDIGAANGVKALYFKSRSTNPAQSGVLRLASTDAIAWRNTANGADVLLAKDSSDNLTYAGAQLTGNPYLGANQTVLTSLVSGTATIVVFNATETDTDSAYNTGTGRYTVPANKGGRYLIASAVEFNPGASTTDCRIDVYRNAALAREGARRLTSPSSPNSIGVSTIINAAAADVLDVRVTQNTGGAIATTATATSCWLTVQRLVG